MRRNPPAKWVLPEIVNPPRTRCFVINVPDERFHIAAFRGAMLDLASAYKWADDPAHTARLVALIWKNVIVNMRDCPDPADPNNGVILEDLMSQQIRLKPDNSCIIQMWCIDDWVDWYDPTNCATGAVSNPPPLPTRPTPASQSPIAQPLPPTNAGYGPQRLARAT